MLAVGYVSAWRIDYVKNGKRTAKDEQRRIEYKHPIESEFKDVYERPEFRDTE
jgi:hypothetical protein